MNTKWGQKRKCPKCESFFYDMGKKEFVCPKCKAKYTEDSFLKAKEKHLTKAQIGHFKKNNLEKRYLW